MPSRSKRCYSVERQGGTAQVYQLDRPCAMGEEGYYIPRKSFENLLDTARTPSRSSRHRSLRCYPMLFRDEERQHQPESNRGRHRPYDYSPSRHSYNQEMVLVRRTRRDERSLSPARTTTGVLKRILGFGSHSNHRERDYHRTREVFEDVSTYYSPSYPDSDLDSDVEWHRVPSPTDRARTRTTRSSTPPSRCPVTRARIITPTRLPSRAPRHRHRDDYDHEPDYDLYDYIGSSPPPLSPSRSYSSLSSSSSSSSSEDEPYPSPRASARRPGRHVRIVEPDGISAHAPPSVIQEHHDAQRKIGIHGLGGYRSTRVVEPDGTARGARSHPRVAIVIPASDGKRATRRPAGERSGEGYLRSNRGVRRYRTII